MDSIKFSYNHALVPEKDLLAHLGRLKPVNEKLNKVRQQRGYQCPESFINVPFDDQLFKTVAHLVQQKKKLKPVLMVVIGIGGSNLGTLAVYEALFGADGNRDFPLYFADTVDSDHINSILSRAKDALEREQAIILTVISKSGSTTETIANFECFLVLLKKYHPKDYHQYVVAITDRDSALWQLAGEQQFDRLEIPKEIGGRYSVLPTVGIFPLSMAGVDIEELRKGAGLMVDQCLLPPFASIEREARVERSPFGLPASIDPNGAGKNLAAISASIIAYHYKRGIHINDMFVFSVALEGLGKWYRQLMGESIGKEYDLQQQKVNVGITPIVSVGSTDLHSMGQLYLGGPYDKLTTFITVEQTNTQITIPNMPEYDKLVPHIQNKTLQVIMAAIADGVQEAYKEAQLPFISITMNKKSAFYIGQFLQFKMIEMIYLGALLDVNPFDQPQVELYKTQDKKDFSS